ncbi:B3 DOMAIN-CONTAINING TRANSCRIPTION FACTOR ABI3 [Salix viminalis]|uniref:B3 DOMAIN-CONTAINING TRANSCRIPTION FACTOR ABI3 n=3 Tax=Salix TaxID=40685 RepID=A0A9Q0UFF9_SALVM|nr:B3 DOMAIN-CONTAINING TRANSCRIPTION FACTOR ABI3 [Salix viminalis]
MKGPELHGEDRHQGVENEGNPAIGFDAMEEEQGLLDEDKEIWLERGQEDLLRVSDVSIFYEDFPPLPDFPCMSSSSSSSSTPAPVKAITSSSSSSCSSSASSAASWAVLKSGGAEEDVEKNRQHGNHYYHHNNIDDYNSQAMEDPVEVTTAALSSTCSMEVPDQPLDQAMEGVECMDVMEDFGYIDLLESNDFFDPSSIFHPDEGLFEEFQMEQNKPQDQPQLQYDQQAGNEEITEGKNDQEADHQGGRSEDLAMVFLDWLKSNKETVSADDLRRVKLKKTTIECAARRLGGGKEGMKQLLKLILQWVQTNHLQRRRLRESSSNVNLPYPYNQDPLQNQNPNPNSNINCIPIPANNHSNPCFTHSPWNVAPPPYLAADPATVMPGFSPMVGDPFSNGASNINGHPYGTPQDYILQSYQTWPPSQFDMAAHFNSFADNNLHSAQPHQNPAFTGYGNQYPYQYVPANDDNRLARSGSSATKEARKKRMARQRRFLSHHRNQNHNHNIQHQNQGAGDPHERLADDPIGAPPGQSNPGSWVYLPTAAGGGSASTTVDALVDRPAMQTQNNYHRQAAAERRQGWKPEKNLRFLLQKVLKQSDVGSLGRIVLPKKEAETHLPELEARDGISIAMEDIGTSRVWNMRYRFWPNNKSRMYLLENTGDFVRTNGLQEGDFIVIYSDVKCGKYMIRGVKVRQPAGPKAESKKAGKSRRNSHANCPAAANNGSGSSSTTMITQTRTVK